MSTKQVLSNARWVGVNQAGRLAVQFLSIAVLSRLLSPSDFGLMAMAAVVTNLALLFRDLGTAAALIQKHSLTDEFIDTIFWLNVVFGIAVGGSVALSGPIAARIFHAPGLAGLLAVISLAFPITSIGASQLALFERESRFQLIAWIEVVSAAAGLLVAIICALYKMGAYSFVFQSLVTGGLSTLQIWFHSAHRPKWMWDQGAFKSVWHFSGNLTAFNLINYFVRNGDSMLIGRFLGAVSLGWYSVANKILLFPLQNITYASNRALFPVYSRYQDDPDRLRSLYLRTLALISSISGPLMLGLWALRRPFVMVVFGPKWAHVIPILAWFAPMGLFQSMASTAGTILSAIGRTDLLRTLGIVSSITAMTAFIFGLRFGLIGLVIAYAFATVLLTLLSLHITLQRIHSGILELIAKIWKQTTCAIAMAITVWVLDMALRTSLSAYAILAALVPLGAAWYIILLYFCSRPSLTEVHKALWHRASVVAS